MDKLHYTTTELSKKFSVSRQTVISWIEHGYISAEKRGRKYYINAASIAEIEQLGQYIIGLKPRDWPRLLHNMRKEERMVTWLEDRLTNSKQSTT